MTEPYDAWRTRRKGEGGAVSRGGTGPVGESCGGVCTSEASVSTVGFASSPVVFSLEETSCLLELGGRMGPSAGGLEHELHAVAIAKLTALRKAKPTEELSLPISNN